MESSVARDRLEDMIEDRWRTLTIGIGGGSAEETNSNLISGWMEKTRQLLGRMIHGAQEDAEYTLLCNAEDHLLTLLQEHAEELALTVETQRAAEKAGTAA